MTVTLNQVLGIVLTVAAVVAVTFLVLFLNQLRKTARGKAKRPWPRRRRRWTGFR